MYITFGIVLAEVLHGNNNNKRKYPIINRRLSEHNYKRMFTAVGMVWLNLYVNVRGLFESVTLCRYIRKIRF